MRQTAIKLSIGCALLLALCSLSVEALDIDKIDIPKLNKLNVPEIDRVTLENGIKLYLLKDKSLPLLNINVRINGGSYLEPADKAGLASICGTVMRTGGTEKWTGDEIDQTLEAVGASVETGFDLLSGTARVNVLSEYTELGLKVLADVLRTPVFDQDKIDLAKVQTRTGISRRNDDISGVALREYRKLIFGKDSPYARHPEYATIDAIERDDLVKFHGTWVKPENVQMAIWGDFDRKELLSMINQYFGDWKRGSVEVPPPPKVDYDWRSKLYYVEKTDVEQSYIRMGHLGGLVSDPDYADRIVMNSILGGGFGSRVTNEVRVKLGLAYMAGGRLISNFSYPGYFFMLASTKPGSTIQATKAMIEQIKSMQTDAPTEEEMQKGKDGYLNSFVFNFDTRSEVLNRMMTYDFHGLPEDFLQQEKEKVEHVSPEAVMAAANANLQPDNMIVLLVGNKELFDAPMEELGLGEAEIIDITIPTSEDESELDLSPESLEKGKAILLAGVIAAGGLENFKAINSISIKGNMMISMQGQEFGIATERLMVYPDKHREVSNFMGQAIYDIRNGDEGWKTSGMSGELADMTPEDIEDAKKSVSRDWVNIFMHSDEPYYQAAYDGTGELGGIAVDWVAIVGEDDKPLTYLGFDESRKLVGKKQWGETMSGEGMIETTYSDFQTFNGIVFPMSTLSEMNGQKIQSFSTSERIINGDVPAGSFDKPE